MIRRAVAAGAVLLAGCATASAPARPAPAVVDDATIAHVLGRLGYGARPGDVARVRGTGLDAWIDAQLHPERIDDAAVQARLAALPTLAEPTPALLHDYPPPRPGAAPAMGPERRTRPLNLLLELQAARLVRAVESERQLQEVMVDFWLNHFNVFWGKGADRWYLTSFERDVIRPHALGRFPDLLRATARHPAMLFYLDNWVSGRPGRDRRPGLNENYARELMELHTLGVDGGYDQHDVTEVARAFTGWSIDGPRRRGAFVFRPGWHDDGAKLVLGHRLPAGGGERDGERVLDLLARHPSTARFIATKLVRRFVADDPPPALVARVAATYRATDGDVRAMFATIFASPEFRDATAARTKVKTPLEYVAGAVRALDGHVDLRGGLELARVTARLGEPLYGAQPPTGYPDRAEAWVSAGALLARLDYAVALTHGRIPGVHADPALLVGGVDLRDPRAVLDRLLGALLHGDASAVTRHALLAHLDDPRVVRLTGDDGHDGRWADTDVPFLAALLLGAPELERR